MHLPVAALASAITTVSAASSGEEPKPLDHVVDKVFAWMEWGETKVPLLTMHMVTLMVAAVLTLLLLSWVSRRMAIGPESEGHRRYLPKGRLAQFVEMVIVYLRDEMLEPILGEKNTRKYLPILLTFFFFIWVTNLLGLLPLLDIQHLGAGWARNDFHFALVGGTATGNIAVTGALATIAFLVIQIHGFRDLGVIGWAKHLTGGAPWWIAWLLVPIELLGTFMKPVALAIRLFANMLAGHTLMATVLMFGFMALSAGMGWLAGGLIGAVSGVFALALYFLELFVATLQAFVFMFLTAVFIGQLSHHDDHDEEHGEAHGEAHGDSHGHAPAPAH